MTDRIEKFAIVDKIEKGYTRIPNATMQDPNLTDSAYRVLSFLLSINKGFNPTIKKIAKILHMTEKKVQRAIALLKSTGYISVKRYKNGSLYGGIQWQISNFPGHFNTDKNDTICMDKIDHIYVDKNDDVENVHTCMDKTDPTCMDKIDQTCTDKNDYVENVHISQQTKCQQPTNVKDQQMSKTNECQQPLLQTPTEDEEAEVSSQRVKGENFGLGSSEAKASPLSGKNSSGEQVMTQREFEYQQFLKKYPKRVYPNDVEATKTAFFEATALEGSFAEIMAGLDAWCSSTDWKKLDGQYISRPVDFLTTRMWEKIPRTINTEIDPGLMNFMLPPNWRDLV